MLGALLALASALTFSAQSVLVRRGVSQASASQGAFITVLIGVPLFFVATVLTGQILHATDLSLTDYALLACAGAVHFAFGRFFNYRAIGAIGAARTAPIQALTTPYSIVVALLFLGESVNPGMAVGIAMIIFGPILMVERTAPARVSAGRVASVPTSDKPATFQLRQAEGYISAALAAVAYGTSPVLIRAALEGHSGVSILGGLVSYAAAASILLVGLALPGRSDLLSAMRPSTVRLFLSAGTFVFLAQMFRFVALSLAPVAVVATLTRTNSVFTLCLSWLVNRSLEHITWRVAFGVAVSALGTIVVVATRGG